MVTTFLKSVLTYPSRQPHLRTALIATLALTYKFPTNLVAYFGVLTQYYAAFVIKLQTECILYFL